MPPASSALDLYFVPKIFPIFTPTNEIKKVQTPIIDAADTEAVDLHPEAVYLLKIIYCHGTDC